MPDLASRDEITEPADWYVFEAIVADGTLSVGIMRGTPNPEQVMVIAEHLTRSEAEREAQRIASVRKLREQ